MLLNIKKKIKKLFPKQYQLLKDWKIRREIRKWSQHDAEMKNFYAQFVEPGDLCFDVGANVGNRVKIFLALGAKVVAVEPQQYCIQMLQKVFGAKKNFILVPQALGEKQQTRTMRICSDAPVLSSFSASWIDQVIQSGRFKNQNWDQEQQVQMTTLDDLITEYGIPTFIKIDVEGFEEMVVAGLHQPVRALCLEFTPERLQPTLNCLNKLSLLGKIELNLALGEDMKFVCCSWVSIEEMKKILLSYQNNTDIFGDVYVRFIKTSE